MIKLIVTLMCCSSVFLMSCTSQPKKTNPNKSELKLGKVESKVYDKKFGINVYVKEWSRDKKQTMVLIHGLGQKASLDWLNLESLLKKHYHLILIDLPGFGKSQGKLNVNPNPKLYAHTIKKIVDKYKVSDKIILVGHSMGAATSLYYLSLFPESVKESVLMSVAGVLEKTVYAKELSAFNSNLKNKKGDERKAKNYLSSLANKLSNFSLEVASYAARKTRHSRRKMFPKNNKLKPGGINIQAGLGLVETNFTPVIYSVNTPVLLIWGMNDKIASLRVAKILNQRLNKSTIKYLKSVGHVPQAAEPYTVYKMMQDWLGSNVISHTASFKTTSKNYTCEDDDKHRKITGGYNEIIINNCNNLVLENIAAKKISVNKSNVMIEGMIIKSDRLAVDIYDSQVNITNLDVEAPEVFNIKKSIMDIAGSNLIYKYSLMDASDSTVRWSVNRVKEVTKDNYIYKHGEEVF